MKLFQQLLVAPAALGLLAPLAANAAEVNINTVDYASPIEQGYKTSSAQFSDVVPGDWAYTALQNISESYGCVDNAYTQSLKNGQALTRYEAAALINACLSGGLSASNEGVSSDASRLADEFASEMAILKGRVDGLEYKLNEFEAGQFASTTKMSGSAALVTGITEQNDDGTKGSEALHSTYRYGIDLNTSFSGQDNLYVGLETGNVDSANDYVLLSDYVDPSADNGVISVTSLFYSFPVGDFDVAVGPLLDQDDLVPTTTSTYSNAFMLDGWGLGPQAISLNGLTGTGAAVGYTGDNGFNAGLSLISLTGEDATKGIATDETNDVLSLMAGWDGDNWGGGIVYSQIDDLNSSISTAGGYTVPTTFDENPNVIGVGAYWTISDAVDLSVGADFVDIGIAGYEDATLLTLGVDYEAGPGTVSAGIATIPYWDASNNYDSAGAAYELYYDYPIADGISIKPGLMIVDLDSSYETSEFTSYAVEATFSF